ncbi:MAG: type III pantothenate kinase [Proteobacteria bacterium]|nr:type III pantothenate kinase [Pseudomonadota bacterium]MBU1389996.1 type III pantothenate kinase [Pseudomonadota bacterium]MBU1545053.1 type III pantothenate kinase [Pseudomonadota bacterium]MBU2431302.1 type III pantothenate kinase [Pseudomonadota bacterium]MBU2480432.1 type III pantothenate kinase [Pseudomonadota bacterium]
MLLVIDVGNTNTVIGVYDNDILKHDWRIRTVRESTADEFNVLANALFMDKGVNRSDIEKTVISSVVPSSVPILNAFCEKYLKMTPVWINPDSVKKLMPILYSNPNEVGADRIVNAVAAYKKYQTAMIIIDFGTATTFDVISGKGEYLGGAIVPGVMIAADALFQKASRLPRVEIFQAPEKVIGKDTINSIKSGVIYGNAAMVDGMVERMTREMGENPKIIATGGLAPLISKFAKTIESVEQSLTLDGLRIISNEI